MTTCWGITDGSAGMVSQVSALAEALGLELQLKRVRVKKPLVLLPNILFVSWLIRLVNKYFLTDDSDSLAGPWPKVVISCGRRGAIVTMGMRAEAMAHGGERPHFIHIQDPQTSARRFDVVLAMEHDKIQGPNVIKSRLALHSITPEKLAAAREKFAPRFAAYPRPLVAVMLGGSTQKYKLTAEKMELVIAALRRLLDSGSSLLITASRRTGVENIVALTQALGDNPRVYIYDGVEENPYMGMLALADSLVVSNDSVNMVSEAYVTGKPLHILRFCGHADTKPARFAEKMVASGAAQWLSDGGAKAHAPVDDMARVVAEIRRLIP